MKALAFSLSMTFVLLLGSPASPEAAAVSQVAESAPSVTSAPPPAVCAEVLAPKSDFRAEIPRGGLEWSTHILGLVVGSANGIAVTLLGVHPIIPPLLAKWLPFFNDIANVASTATGRRWLYSGLSKRAVDGVALGSIIGHSVITTARHGPLAGAIALAISAGVTYWIPNRYLRPAMTSLPKLLPQKIRAAMTSAAGQGVIGASVIVVLEAIFRYAQSYAHLIPKLFSAATPSGGNATFDRMIASVSPNPFADNVDLRHALALYFLDGALTNSIPNDSTRFNTLVYLAGGPSMPTRDSDRAASAVRTVVLSALHSRDLQLLLTNDEIRQTEARARAL